MLRYRSRYTHAYALCGAYNGQNDVFCRLMIMDDSSGAMSDGPGHIWHRLRAL